MKQTTAMFVRIPFVSGMQETVEMKKPAPKTAVPQVKKGLLRTVWNALRLPTS